ncbi:putative biotin biosynthesis protein BioC [Mycobacterium xenopi 3993]|nr:putative biotin biosynthesis protein BioC [Mycobacterium xenopi 3993]
MLDVGCGTGYLLTDPTSKQGSRNPRECCDPVVTRCSWTSSGGGWRRRCSPAAAARRAPKRAPSA